MTNSLLESPPPDVQRSRHKSRTWGVTAAALLLAVCAGMTYLVVDNGQQDTKLTALTGVIDKQNSLYGQVCKLAGGQVNTDPAAREACARVERGEPAVPIPVVVTGAPGLNGSKGEPGVGVLYVRQLDRCFVEVVLTNGVINRFGSFCGADGQTGATGVSGQPGASGEPGTPGATGQQGEPGVGIAAVQAASANPCLVDVALTDGSVRTIGPFCGPPLGEFTTTDENSVTKRCVRDGGPDSAPNYTCRPVASSTTTAATTTTTTPPLIPTP